MDSVKYRYRVSPIKNDEWEDILSQFSDANIYQTEAFNKSAIGGEILEQFLLFKNDTLAGSALIRLKLLPIIKRGVAYVRWAPMWQKKNEVADPQIFGKSLKYLYDEYVVRRKLVLRIMSNLFEEDSENYSDIFKENGFQNYVPTAKSIVVNLNPDEEELRSNLRKKWRYSLRQAEKNNLRVEISQDENAYMSFLKIYQEMHERKNFQEFVDVETFGTINSNLSAHTRMNIFICYKGKEALSAVVISAIGDTGIYLLGASNLKGLELASSYLLQWEVIKWLKSSGLKFYNLGGIDSETNPGVYTFKSGMGGKEVTYLGGFEACRNWASKSIIQIGEKVLHKS
jgi:hypothetical protein